MDSSIHPTKEKKHSSVFSYAAGFLLSIILTLIPYFAVAEKWATGGLLVMSIVAIAVVQLLVQVFFFLHLGRGNDARWNIMAAVFTIVVVFIVVIGSLWVMNNLNYNMMSPSEMDTYMKKESQKGF